VILRRLATAIRRQDWFAVAIETLIVVAGVFLGLQVNNWNAARIERETAVAYVGRIKEDLRANQAGARGLIEYYSKVREHGERALAAFDQPAESLGAPFLIDLYQTTQISPRPIRRNAYDELLAVGAVNAIGKIEMRQRIANYYANAELTSSVVSAVPPFRDRLRRVMPIAVQRAIRSQCAENFKVDESGASASFLPDGCAITLPPDTVRDAVAEIMADGEMRADLVRYVSDLDVKLINYNVLGNRAEELELYLMEAK
jgi:hypothetical protein